MRPKLNSRKELIAQFVTSYFEQHDRFPSEKNIVEATGIPAGSVHRYLTEMKESGAGFVKYVASQEGSAINRT